MPTRSRTIKLVNSKKVIYIAPPGSENVFIRDPRNRPITPRHEPRLIELNESMQINGNLFNFPIFCAWDEEPEYSLLKILDGQHRYHTAVGLGLPIYYTIAENPDIEIGILAKAQSNWVLDDFIDRAIAAGDPDYVKLNQLRQAHPGLPLGAAINLLRGGVTGRSYDAIKSGTFTVTRENIAFANVVLDAAEAVKSIVPEVRPLGSQSIQALCRFAHLAQFRFPQFIARVRAHPSELRKGSSMDDYSYMYEEVYNFHSKSAHVSLTDLAKDMARKIEK